MTSKIKTHIKHFLIGLIMAAIGASMYGVASVAFSDFTAGTTISSADMNTKLNALKNAVNNIQVSDTAFVNSLATGNTGTVAVHKSATIPGPGVVLAIATGYVFHSHTNGGGDTNTVVSLRNTPGTTAVNGYATVEVRTPSAMPTSAWHAVPYSITTTFTEATGGVKDYYVNCRLSSGTAGYCYGNNLTLLYFENKLAP
jgi:hypothetical protein